MTPDDTPVLPPQRYGALRAVGRNLGWLLASRGVMAALSLVYLAVIARALGVTGFGRFALVTGAAQALATLVAFQTWQVVVAYGVGPVLDRDEAKLARLFRGAALLDLASAVVGSLLAVLILEVWSEKFGISPTLKRAALIFAIIDVVTISSTPIGILRLRDKFSLAAIAETVTPIGRFIGAFAVLLIHPTVQGFLVAWGIAEVLTAIAYWWMAARTGDLKLLWRGGGGGIRTLLAEYPGILRYAFSTNATTTIGMAGKQVPLLVVGAALGPAAAGSFRLAAQLAQALAKSTQLLSRAAFPEVVKAVRDATPRTLRRILLRMVGASLLTGGAILFIIALFGRTVLDFIAGQHFSHSYGVLMYMAAAGCVEFVTIALETIMTARGRAGSVLMVRLAAAGVIFGVAWPILRGFGPTGMAAAVLVGAVAGTGLMALTAWRAIHAPPLPRADSAGSAIDASVARS